MNDMTPLITCRNMKWSVILHIVILFTGSFISYIMAYINGSVTIFLPFFSETGAKVPEICVFSYFLILGSFFGVVAISYRYIMLKHILTPDYPKLLKVNFVSFICGLISMAGLAGVAAIPMSTVLSAHLVAAGSHFVFAMLFTFLQTFTVLYSPIKHSKWNKLRLMLSFLLIVFLVVLLIIFPISQKRWKELNNKPAALKSPQDPGFGLLFTSSLFEWLVYGIFLAYLLTFFFDFNEFQLVINVAPIADRDC